VSTFVCPSDNAYERPNIFLAMRTFQSAPTSFSIHPVTFTTDARAGRTNYAGSAGLAGNLNMPANVGFTTSGGFRSVDSLCGPLAHRTKFAPNDILDGTSQTIMFGEALFNNFSFTTPAPDTTSAAWMGVGISITFFPPDNKGDFNRFSSRHPGTVQFCLVDGSVRGLNTSISHGVYLTLGGIRDGVTPANY
jgi:prepilin-type processing-associated H-X9-DG protein